MKRTLPFILLISVIGFALIFSGCDDRSVEVPDYYISYIGTDLDTIYADNNTETFATITVVVKDNDNVPVTDQTVTFTSNIGQINKDVITNESGIATSEFHDLGMVGPVIIAAKIANSVETLNMTIKAAPAKYISRMSATPEKLYADEENVTTAEIHATVRNSEGTLLSNETVYFDSDLGEITVSAVSNESGIAIATFTETDEIGDATISARIGSQSMSISFPIEAPPSYTIVNMSAIPDQIYADNNLTYSTIRAVVRDAENFAVGGELVRFRIVPDNEGYSVGNLISNVYTDSSGVAETTFWDQQDIGTAIIEALVGTVTRQVTVEVLPEPTISSVILDTTFISNIMIDQVRTVSANAKNEYDEFVEDGTLMTFTTVNGYFQDGTDTGTSLGKRVMVETSNGTGTAYLNAGQTSGMNIVTAFIGEVEDSVDFSVKPGNSVYLTVTTEEDTIQVNGNEEYWVAAAVTDRYGNAVLAGKSVSFETTIGSITSPNFTNAEGIATASFSSGLEAGLAEITCVADSASGSAVVNVISDDVHSLTFQFDGQVDIYIEETGGIVSRDLIVDLWDMTGNPVLASKDVWFKFVYQPPMGCNINETVWSTIDSVRVTSVNGSAIVSVNSGSEPGTVTIQAFTFNDNGQRVSVTRSNIVIHAGPPRHVDGGIGEYDTGTNVGSGLWQVGISAIITDYWGNPVDIGTAVWFSIDDETIDWATVIAEAYVGNLNEEGDSLQGVAFSRLIYDGSHTFELLPVRIECGELSETIYYELPLNSPQLEMIPLPGHLDFTQGTGYTTVTGEIQINVTDGQGSPIHGAMITLYSTRGEFLEPDDEYVVPGEAYWIVQTSDYGIARARMLFHEYECPPVIPPPNEVPVDVTATIVGTEVTDQTTVILLNYR